MNTKQDTRRSKWISIVNEFNNSKLTQAEFSRKNDLDAKQLSSWVRKLKHNGLLNQETIQEWVALKSQTPQEFGVNSPSTLNIKIGCATIEVQDGFNSSLLVQVVDTLRSIC
ncbi:hypothetical protein EHE19_017150 [Ruminiclostridium herbifermentans]|uniref:Transposase n=1 Tax=Ruminiclostridium herbifermentans TaxID=2488810 RepID=A0A4U7JAG4_9FIRM|nr:hypothetical protein [Ruminiclostridium herbifermentans]QNU66557.1 hypothetical protein EHE19_017150 [Ruminiclostridium herbifermentans]